jgi:hypothetical protein
MDSRKGILLPFSDNNIEFLSPTCNYTMWRCTSAHANFVLPSPSCICYPGWPCCHSRLCLCKDIFPPLYLAQTSRSLILTEEPEGDNKSKWGFIKNDWSTSLNAHAGQVSGSHECMCTTTSVAPHPAIPITQAPPRWWVANRLPRTFLDECVPLIHVYSSIPPAVGCQMFLETDCTGHLQVNYFQLYLSPETSPMVSRKRS